MRILKLRFQNLNSLVGEWEIDLDHPAYSSDGIFAITGPTGAGKSTILDALCLALYGATPRLNKVTRSGNEIMSRHTGECFAEVTFATQAGNYRCHWSQHRSRRKPDGELQAPRHEIADADFGAVLESRLKGVAEQIEIVTGMDFERFTRSMLLAQGGFAAFLQAPPDERAPILEQITGTEIYSKISIRVHELKRQEREKLERLRAETAGITVMGSEEEDELRRTLETREADEQELGDKLAETERAVSWLRAIDELQTEISDLVEKEKQLQSDISTFRPDRDKLKRAEGAATLEGPYATLDAVRTQQNADAAALQDEATALPGLEAEAAKRSAALNSAAARTARAKAEREAATSKLRDLRALDQRLTDQGRVVGELEESRKRDEAQINELKQAQAAEQEQRAAVLADLETAERYLRDYAHDEWLVTGLTGIEQRFDGFLSGQARLTQKETEVTRAGTALIQATEQLEEVRQQSARRTQEVETATARLQEEKDALSRLLGDRLLRECRAEKESLLREQAFQTRITALEDYRARLEDGKPCPLCGATEHPFAHGNLPDRDETDLRIEELDGLITAAEEKEASVGKAAEVEASARRNLADAEKDETSAAQAAKLAEQRLAELRKDLQELRTDLNTRRDDALALLQPLGVTEIPEDGAASLLESLRARLVSWQDQLVGKSTLEKRLGEIDERIGRLETTLNVRREAVTEKEKELESRRAELAAGNNERKSTYGEMDPNQEEHRLNAAVADAEQVEQKAREHHDAVQENWNAAKTRRDALSKRVGDREAELTRLEGEFTALLRPAGFADEQAFLDARLTVDERTALRQKADELDNQTVALKTRRTDREASLAARRAEELTDTSLDELEPRRMEYLDALKELREAITEIKHRLRENAAARERLQDKEKEITAQQQECLRWDTLHDLIGSADGKKYRNFAQGLTFEMMIGQANRQLQKLTDRYLLTRENENSLELNVVDNYQAGEIRSTKNLSGGESFIVSLALALGLSQMAGKNVRVDSLFLDEGFGTLDEEALDTALETLAGLQQEGKVIGVISHVGALKERISTRIQVIPHNGGRSRITGPGCRSL